MTARKTELRCGIPVTFRESDSVAFYAELRLMDMSRSRVGIDNLMDALAELTEMGFTQIDDVEFEEYYGDAASDAIICFSK